MTEAEITLVMQDGSETTPGAAIASGIRSLIGDEQDIESALKAVDVDTKELVVSVE